MSKFSIQIVTIIFATTTVVGFGQTAIALHGFQDNDFDAISDSEDNCPYMNNPNQGDLDNDGIGDLCDPICEKYLSEEFFPNGDATLNPHKTLNGVTGWSTQVVLNQKENVVFDLNLTTSGPIKLNKRSSIFLKSKGMIITRANPRWVKEWELGHSYKLSFSIDGLPSGKHDIELIHVNPTEAGQLTILNFNMKALCEYENLAEYEELALNN